MSIAEEDEDEDGDEDDEDDHDDEDELRGEEPAEKHNVKTYSL